jgi:hypothetical protein
MTLKTLLLSTLTFGLFSFIPGNDTVEFSYPDIAGTTITMTTSKFKTFEKEKQGTDYYYSCQNSDGMICSVLFYKLDPDEVKKLVEMPAQAGGPATSPVYPLTYFSTNSKTKDIEINEQKWGSPAGDFMFRQADIKEFQGTVVNQKSMYAYAMLGKDMFVSVHLSKLMYTTGDSTEMRKILATLKKKK